MLCSYPPSLTTGLLHFQAKDGARRHERTIELNESGPPISTKTALGGLIRWPPIVCRPSCDRYPRCSEKNPSVRSHSSFAAAASYTSGRSSLKNAWSVSG